jgi:molybdenum storage protein
VTVPSPVWPRAVVVKIGGQSIIDRGDEPLRDILDLVISARRAGVDVLICTGGGTRARSIYSLASELRLPTGVLAALGARVATQNARIVQTMLARFGGVYFEPDDFGQLPLAFRAECIPVMGGMPPYSYWEQRFPGSRVPPHRTDAGAFLTAEYLGAYRVVYVKDEDGLFTDDPKADPDARHIPMATAAQVRELNLQDVVIERVVVEYLPRAVYCRAAQIVNGFNADDVRAALHGKSEVGSLIVA